LPKSGDGGHQYCPIMGVELAMYDLLVKGGTVIDPSQQINGRYDIAISEGKIASVAEEIPSSSARKIVDAKNGVVTPGLIDLHTHVYWGATRLSLNPDLTSLPKGVTTVLDAGSSGCTNFLGLRKFIIEPSRTRVLALLHISSIGLASPSGVTELEDVRNIDYDGAVKVAQENRDVILGMKIRLGVPPVSLVGRHGQLALRLALEAAEDMDGLLMVHPKGIYPGVLIQDVLRILRKGDILTHFLHPQYSGFPQVTIFSEEGKLLPEMWEARKRGVVFDVGHGSGSLSFENARKAFAEGFEPTTISTDLFTTNVNGPVYDLPTTMSKFLNLGLPLEKVVEMTTLKPAQVLGKQDEIGTLKLGVVADVAVFTLEEGTFTFRDVRRQTLIGNKRLVPHTVIRAGEVVVQS
jgi:dihydroorotase